MLKHDLTSHEADGRSGTLNVGTRRSGRDLLTDDRNGSFVVLSSVCWFLHAERVLTGNRKFISVRLETEEFMFLLYIV